ncbi:MAG: hypothetical protein HOV68_20785 [Streptomycetaceae bacterium]|nr:hypothetical protein [Streptomycetaceae bacterium]
MAQILAHDPRNNPDPVGRVAASPWPELPDDGEMWDFPAGARADREDRTRLLDREQAGG